jgi:predicted acetyltransferase
MTIEVALVGPDRHDELTVPLRTAFGFRFDPERAERTKRLPELVQRIAGLDGGKIISSAGAFRFEMTTPGGRVAASGLTMVGVLPTHRRRGILHQMMALHLDEARKNGFPISALWASEGSIYGRFGYGMASLHGSAAFDTHRAAFARPVEREGVFELLDENEALEPCQSVYEQVRPAVPGMLGRSPEWWAFRRLGDFDKSLQPYCRAVLRIGGRPEGYALYRLTQPISVPGPTDTAMSVTEVMGTSPRATAMVWRYLFEVDLVRRIEAPMLSSPHALLHLFLEPRRLALTVGDGLWVRLVDAEAALAARSFPAWGGVRFGVTDARCPWNAGVYCVEGGRAGRSSGAPELRFDVGVLGSLYLGGVTARELADVGAIEELVAGAVDRADGLFRSPRTPWCPEIF